MVGFLGIKRGASLNIIKLVVLMFFFTILSLITLKISLAGPLSTCTACNGVEICASYDLCCGVLDGYCPEQYGDWQTAGCSAPTTYSLTQFACDTEDEDCCASPAAWEAGGWAGISTRDPYSFGATTNSCCGNEPNENIISCKVNALDYASGCSPCTDTQCNVIANQGCCYNSNDCFDPYTNSCYNNGYSGQIGELGYYAVCNAGTWNKGTSGYNCTNATNDCKSSLYCVDYDYNGTILPPKDLGICGSCDGTASIPNSNKKNLDVCGAIASDGSVWGICNGMGQTYPCFDQSNTDGDGYCIKNNALSDITQYNPIGAGLMTVFGDQGRNYIRCAGDRVCNGTTNMDWTQSTNPNFKTDIGNGSCVQINTNPVVTTLVDSDDITSGKISLYDSLKIILTADYKVDPLYSKLPNWLFLFGCWLNTTKTGSIGCSQSSINNPNNVYLFSGAVDIINNKQALVNYYFEPNCSFSYLGAYSINYSRVYTGWLVQNNWMTSETFLSSQFKVVQCEDNTDAQAIANSISSGVCAPGLGCSQSYCNLSEEYTACPTDLDDTIQCNGASAPNCCSHYGFDWLSGETNICCGDDPKESANSCHYNITVYPLNSCNPCTDENCVVINTKSCCTNPTDCVDPIWEVCYETGYNGVVGANNQFAVCNDGNWTKGQSGSLCVDPLIDCDTGYYCVDQDYNGIISIANPGICAKCDGTADDVSTSKYNLDVCGAIAYDGNVYGICSGGSQFYQCFDQSDIDGDGYCIKNNALNDISSGSLNEGGLMNTSSDRGRNYIRCLGNRVCNGTTSMDWTRPNNNPSYNKNIGNGSCTQVDTQNTAAQIQDLNDTSPQIVSINHILSINLTTIYSQDLSFFSSPNWTFLFGCWLNNSQTGSDACAQSSYFGNRDTYYWSFNKNITNNQKAFATYYFEPDCNSSYVGAYNISFVKTYTGWLTQNNWMTTSLMPTDIFSVVQCENDTDAQSVANYNNGTQCSPDGVCALSYCSSNQVVACPTDLDESATCNSADSTSCCSYYNYTWATSGERTAPFGGYGNAKGNTNLTNPDTGIISQPIDECCGNNAGEYFATNVSFGEILAPNGLCCSKPDQCAANGVCNDLATIGGHETCDYLGNCVGVNPTSSCYDGLDNDCDNSTDFCDGENILCPINDGMKIDKRDSDCLTTIMGKVVNTDGTPMGNAFVKAKQRLPLIYNYALNGNSFLIDYRVFTAEDGTFVMSVNGNQTYDLIAGKEGYAPTQIINIIAGFRQTIFVDITLNATISDCNADCTTTASPLCTAACDGWNGCTFYSAKAIQLCDGKQPSFKVQYSVEPLEDLTCCIGSPQAKEPIRKLDKKVATDKKNLVRVTKPLVLDGNQVTMVIDVFS